MDSAKFLVALVVVIACMYLWYQRGLITREHEVCLEATQALMEQLSGAVALDKSEQYEGYIEAYTGWYTYCRASQFERRNPEMYEFLKEEANRQDAE